MGDRLVFEGFGKGSTSDVARAPDCGLSRENVLEAIVKALKNFVDPYGRHLLYILSQAQIGQGLDIWIIGIKPRPGFKA